MRAHAEKLAGRAFESKGRRIDAVVLRGVPFRVQVICESPDCQAKRLRPQGLMVNQGSEVGK